MIEQRISRFSRSRAVAARVTRHPVGLPVLLFMLLVVSSGVVLFFGINTQPHLLQRPDQTVIVHVTIEGEKTTVPTDARTVGALLKKMNIRLADRDRVEPALSAEIASDNMLINVYRAEPVVVLDRASVRRGASAAATPRGLAEQIGVVLSPEDRFMAEPTTNFVAQQSLGNRVTILRATEVAVSLYSGAPVSMRTHAKTVGEFIKAKKISVTKQDTVKPGLKTLIQPGMTIAVVRNGVQTVTMEEEIPPPVRTIIDGSLSFGSQAVRQEGSAGRQTKTYQVTVENGEEVRRVLLQTIVTVQPVERIVAKGNTVNIPPDKIAVMAAAGISPNEYMYVDYIFSRESRWNAAAVSSNGYYGLGQTSLARLSGACPNWASDPVCQTRLFTGYAGRYGGWEGAYNFWLRNHWW